MDGLNINVTAADQTTTRPRYRNLPILREDGKNFLCWKAIMPPYFQAESYAWDVIMGDIDPLVPADKSKFDLGNKNARTLLFETVDENLMSQLFNGETQFVTAKDIWTRLETTFIGQTGVFKDQAQARYNAFKFDPSKSITENISEFRKLIYELESLSVGVSNSAACARLITALPRSWESFKQSWSVKDESFKIISNLYEMIIANDARRRFEGIEDEVTALTARSGDNRRRNKPRCQPGFHLMDTQRKQQTYSEDVVTCWNCQKKGHRMNDCWFLKKKNPPKKGKGKPKANYAQVYMTEVNTPEAEKLQVNEQPTFIIDSGSTHNILKDRRLFTQFKPYEQSREVRLGDSRTLKALGEGTAEMTVQNGTKSVCIVLKEALYVPEMKHNLILVTQLLDDPGGNNTQFHESFKRQDENVCKKRSRSVCSTSRKEPNSESF